MGRTAPAVVAVTLMFLIAVILSGGCRLQQQTAKRVDVKSQQSHWDRCI